MDAREFRQLQPRLTRFLQEFDDCFARKDTRAHLKTYVQGQLSDLERKSVEPIADAAGVSARTLQEYLSQLRWNEDLLRDRLQQRVRWEPSQQPLGGTDRRDQFPQAGKEDSRSTTSVLRQHPQAGQLHGHGPFGLRSR